MIAFIEALKDDTCTPKPAKLNAWVYIYIYDLDIKAAATEKLKPLRIVMHEA